MSIIRHRPPHLCEGSNSYFLTSSTLDKTKVFNDDIKKQLLKNCIFESTDKFKIKIIAWVILEEHYHIEFELKEGKILPEFVRCIHGKSSKLVNDIDNAHGRKVWYQYWDSCIRDEKDFWKRFNYIHQNPVKHDCCDDMSKYKYSSYSEYDERWLADCFVNYPIRDFVIDGD